MQEVKEFLNGVIAERQKDPGDDLVSTITTFEIDGRPLAKRK